MKQRVLRSVFPLHGIQEDYFLGFLVVCWAPHYVTESGQCHVVGSNASNFQDWPLMTPTIHPFSLCSLCASDGILSDGGGRLTNLVRLNLEILQFICYCGKTWFSLTET